jgi:hypothetical protein
MREPAKVIEIFSKREMTEMPYTIENAQDIIDYLIKYKNPRTGDGITNEEFVIIDQLLRIVENNSGTNRADVFERGA